MSRSDVKFEEKGHVYSIDGIRIPSVTEILQAEGICRAYGPYERAYAEPSKELHRLIASMGLTGKLPPGTTQILKSVAQRMFEYRRIEREYRLECFNAELVVFSRKYWYAGMLDWFGLVNGDPAIIDWKWSAFYPSYYVQIAGYRRAFLEGHPEYGDVKMYVCPFGKSAKLIPVDVEQFDKIFLMAVELYHWRKKNGCK